MSDKDMLWMAGMFVAMFFVVSLGVSLVGLVTYKLRGVKDRLRCNIATFFGTPIILLVISYLFQLFGLSLLSGFLPLLIVGLFFGGVSVVIRRSLWTEKQIGLSFMLVSATIYALLIVAFQGGS